MDVLVHVFFSHLGLPEHDLVVTLLGTDGEGVPDLSSQLATFSVPSSNLDTDHSGILRLDLRSAGIAVSEGDILAIALQTANPASQGPDNPRSGYYWIIDSVVLNGSDPYPGGAFYNAHGGSTTFLPTGHPPGSSDTGFKTYVLETSEVVAEPPLPDQVFEPETTQGTSISEKSAQAQTFTVGKGGKLVRLDVFVSLFF